MSEGIDILYVLAHGFSSRMILHSNLVPELQALGLRVGVISPSAEEPKFRELVEKRGVKAFAAPKLNARKAHFMGEVRSYVYEDVLGVMPLRARWLRAIQPEQPWRKRVKSGALIGLNRLILNLPQVRQGYAAVESRLLDHEEARGILRRISPRMLVSTYPIDALEATMLHAAKGLSIPTTVQLLSWDNITAKGRFPVVPDAFVAWGPIMSQEIVEHYGVPRDRVKEAGVPHFDVHFDPKSLAATPSLIQGLGLDPKKPYLFFGMSSPIFCPREIDVVEWLAGELRKGRWGPDLQLVVRPHPQNMKADMADLSWLDRLKVLEGGRVRVNYPILEDSALAWAMSEHDLPNLAALLAGCSICLNSGSTLLLDAVAHDKPAVLTLFDAYEGDALPWWSSARRNSEYPHIEKVLALGGVTVAHSFEGLAEALSRHLADASLGAAGRKRLRDAELGVADGQASRRAAAALSTLLGAPSS